MLYEFALDPGVLNNFQTIRYFLEKFGIHHGRLISRFPAKWKKLVYECCASCGDIERKKIEESLVAVDAKLVNSNRSFDGNLPWLNNAENQHNIKPFHAIISSSNPRNVSVILIADNLTETNTLWNVPREKVVSRKAKDLAKYVQPLLQIASEVLFVDPHFDPSEPRYRNILSHFVQSININMTRRIEYHLGNKIRKDHFQDTCSKYIPDILPKGLEVKFIRWERIEGCDALHPRYILTDKGGVRIERGLDEGRDGEFTDVSLLDWNVYAQRWKEYQLATSTFKHVDEIKVTGIQGEK